MQVHHIGYLVKEILPAIRRFEALGYEQLSPAVTDESRGVEICFLRNGDYRIELVSPTGSNSPVYGLLKKYKNTAYHLCYEVDNLEEAIEALGRNGGGFTLFSDPAPAPAISNRRVAFLMSAKIGMIELIEK